MKISRCACLAVFILLYFCIAVFSDGVKYRASGTFSDASGAQHAWSINESHALIWDGEPYIPVGSVFTPSSVSAQADQGSYDADVKQLAAMKAKGITDVVVKGNGPLTLQDPAAWQKIFSYLDTNGFTYGVEMDDGPTEPLSGYLICRTSTGSRGRGRTPRSIAIGRMWIRRYTSWSTASTTASRHRAAQL